MDRVVADFDAIAKAFRAAPQREVLSRAERELLSNVPSRACRAADIGCGHGIMSRALARRGLEVTGLDISPEMIRLARDRTDSDLPVEYRVSDAMTDPFEDGPFDVVLSVNMVHHVSLSAIVPRLASAVAPQGTLLIQDVVSRPGLRHWTVNSVAMASAGFRRLTGNSRATSRLAALYARHGKGESYLEPSQVLPAYESLLPGLLVLHHLEWRYSVIWHRSS